MGIRDAGVQLHGLPICLFGLPQAAQPLVEDAQNNVGVPAVGIQGLRAVQGLCRSVEQAHLGPENTKVVPDVGPFRGKGRCLSEGTFRILKPSRPRVRDPLLEGGFGLRRQFASALGCLDRQGGDEQTQYNQGDRSCRKTKPRHS